jgi:hypothetical protein
MHILHPLGTADFLNLCARKYGIRLILSRLTSLLAL